MVEIRVQTIDEACRSSGWQKACGTRLLSFSNQIFSESEKPHSVSCLSVSDAPMLSLKYYVGTFLSRVSVVSKILRIKRIGYNLTTLNILVFTYRVSAHANYD